MDIEFLFSTNPFTRDQSDGFLMIRPNLASTIELKKKKDQTSGTYEFELPKQFDNKNVLVEVVAGESSKSCLLYTSPSPRDQRGSRMPSSA